MDESKQQSHAEEAPPYAARHCETIHRMTRRCLGWDYRQRAIYMVTIVPTDRRQPLLGRLSVDCELAHSFSSVSEAQAADFADEVQAHIEPHSAKQSFRTGSD